MSDIIEQFGFTAVPRSLDKLIATQSTKKTSTLVSVDEIDFPKTPLAASIHTKLTRNPTGRAIVAQHFPSWKCSPETLLLAALLHDIGTTPANHTSTRLSFEFAGGYLALDLLKAHKANIAQAESVCETIIRHQDLGETGMVSTLTAIIHFATVLDNAGLHGELVAQGTIESVVKAFPREGWTGCFASVVRKECEAKPWSNTTRIEGFAEMVDANKLMEPYDG
ncbi:hypothetical protein Q7P35_005994 [Cladosporium inversicolor]